jgi:bifunctional non-homologous end joining protein LigD
MKATPGNLPTGPGWVYEVKWDGMRLIVDVEPSGVRAWSTRGREATAAFPELASLADALAPLEATLDGEVVALGDDGNPSFERLQHRMHVTSAADARRRAEEVKVAFVVFDLLWLGGHDVWGRPWRERRHLLEQLADDLPPGTDVATIHDDGPALLDVCRQRGLEGVVAKRVDAPYTPGRRARSWVKVKVRQHDEMVVGGWATGEGNRADRLGSLLVGYYEEPGAGFPQQPLRYAGRVGSGFSSAELDRMEGVLAVLADERCPFEPRPPAIQARGVRWVRPEVVVEVAYGDWTEDGRLRHPVYMGQRTDVDAVEVVRP